MVAFSSNYIGLHIWIITFILNHIVAVWATESTLIRVAAWSMSLNVAVAVLIGRSHAMVRSRVESIGQVRIEECGFGL